MARRVGLAILAIGLYTVVGLGQERVATDINWRIRKEAVSNSQIMSSLHWLTDVYGPRLTGSPNLEAAGRWAIDQLAAWGLTNEHLEPFDFGHAGWSNQRLSVHLVAPVADALVVEALAWTPGTEGPVRAEVYHFHLPERPTATELDACLTNIRSDVRGKVVLVGESAEIGVTMTGRARRREDADLIRQFAVRRVPQSSERRERAENLKYNSPLHRAP